MQNLLRGLAYLDRIGGLGELTTPFIVPGSAIVAAAGTSIFCIHNPNGREGLLLNVNFFWDAEDLQTSPVSLVTVGSSQYVANPSTQGQSIMPPWQAPLTLDGSPLNLTSIGGVWFRSGSAIGLQITNNETSSFLAWGCLEGITWSQDQRRFIEKCGLENALPSDIFGRSPARAA